MTSPESGDPRPPTSPTPPEDPGMHAPGTVRDVQYKGAPLDAARGPGLGCFWTQLVLLAVLVVLTPLSVQWDWPSWASGALLVAVLLLLLFSGQTVIFLLRLVAADRRAEGRRRPLGSASRTVGELEDEGTNEAGDAATADDGARDGDPGNEPPGVRE